MNIRNMNDLDWRFSAGSWASGSWFVAHGNGVSFDIWPLAEPKDCEAEKLRGPGANCHDSEVVGEDWTFESNGTGAEKVSLD
jgi:hypothetical protein